MGYEERRRLGDESSVTMHHDTTKQSFLKFIGEKFVLYTPPTASVYRSKEHGYHKCTRIGHSRIFTLYRFDFMRLRRDFKGFLDAMRHSWVNANNEASLLAKIL